MVNDCTIDDDIMTFLVRVQAWMTIHQSFNFSINDYSKYQNTVAFFVFKLLSKKKYSMILELKLFYIS